MSSADLAVYQPWLQQFLSWLNYERGYSQQTLSTYRQQLEAVAQQLSDRVTHWRELTPQLLQQHLMSCRQQLKPRSLALRAAALRSFFHYLVQQQLLTENPAQYLKVPKFGKPLPKNLDTDQMSSLLDLDAMN